MNTKINTNIYIGSGRQNVIPYVQCEFCFIDFGGLRRRACNVRDYKLENVANAFLVIFFYRKLVNNPTRCREISKYLIFI
jgi:hypothetical protein